MNRTFSLEKGNNHNDLAGGTKAMDMSRTHLEREVTTFLL